MDFSAILASLQSNWRILAIIGVVMVGSLAYGFARMRKIKDDSAAFVQQHPDAAKVLLSSGSGVTSQQVQVLTVNDNPPQVFQKKTKYGVFLLPGENVLSVRYTYTRPGVMYKTVSKTYEDTIAVTSEANKSYTLSYDRKAEQFVFAETAE
ncbi:MAG: hypothetical protein LBS96_05375 [Oscillospiraceae bacterium]|jgi:hypothetical protein|nr:hypothetical protein [Oscillospiraceae bacterium]